MKSHGIVNNRKNVNLIYKPQYIKTTEKNQILNFISNLRPIWEHRFSDSNPPPDGEENRLLLRPVYWLGNWQFACLDYYHPPKGLKNRCVTAEPYPQILQKIINQIESLVHESFHHQDIPNQWHLNTCLINYYGYKIDPINQKKADVARVGEHKDFEPGPVASISFGEKALFQFIKSESKSTKSEVVLQQWLEDSSLQIFGGDKLKKQLFHRVQRVEDKGFKFENFDTPDFETRRINFTFRFVPNDHIVDFKNLPDHLKKDVQPYLLNLAEHSSFWKSQII